MENDQYGRSVVFTSDGVLDTYTVSGGGQVFTLQVMTGTPIAAVYSTINAMAPASA